MRILLCGIKCETTSFNPQLTELADFQQETYLVGDEILEKLVGSNTEIGGALEVLGEVDFQPVPALFARAIPGGPLSEDGFLALQSALVQEVERRLPVDGVLCTMHGALAAEETHDVTGALLRAIRDTVGPGVPLATTLDFHANVTEQVIDVSDFVMGFRTFPHVDMSDTGRRATMLLLRAMRGEFSPTCAMTKLPLLLPPENAQTTHGPMRRVMEFMAELEGRKSSTCVGSLFQMHPWLDIPDVGCSTVFVVDNDVSEARHLAERVADLLWLVRREFTVDLWNVDEALRLASSHGSGPFVLADSADAVTSGATGDDTVVLHELLRWEGKLGGSALVPMVDPAAVAQLYQYDIGEQVSISLGGSSGPGVAGPVQLRGELRAKSTGEFRIARGVERGLVWHRGKTVVVREGEINVVISERKVSTWSLEFYESIGLSPRDARVVVVKSPNGFRTEYEPIAERCLVVSSGGVCNPNLRALPWRHVSRPIYPLDELEVWRVPEGHQR